MSRKTKSQNHQITLASRTRQKPKPEIKTGTTYDGGTSDDRKSAGGLDGGGAF